MPNKNVFGQDLPNVAKAPAIGDATATDYYGAGGGGGGGTPGSAWFVNTGAPSSGLGITGDFYLRTSNGDYYHKTDSVTWSLQGNLTGPAGSAGSNGSNGAAGAAGATGAQGPAGNPDQLPVTIGVALSDESTVLATGTRAKLRTPFGFLLTEVRASLTIADTAVISTFNVLANGTTIFTTKPTIDLNEKTTVTAAVPAILSTPLLPDDAELTFTIDLIGTVARGAKVWLIGTHDVSATATVPGQVGGLAATPASTAMGLTWGVPSNGNSAITDYLVEYKASASGTWLVFTDGVSTSPAATVTGLTNGTSYDFRVSAINSIGTGPPSTVATAVPAGVPAQVGTVTPTPGNAQVSLAWAAPANNGNAIVDYFVEYKLTSSGTWLTFVDAVSSITGAVVTGLVNASGYDFRVSAINSIGTGTASATVSSTPAAGGMTPGTYNISPTVHRHVLSTANTSTSLNAWLEARDGNVNAVLALDSNVGNVSLGADDNVSAGDDFYDVWQAFLEFDTTVASGTVSSATLKITVANDFSTTDFTIEARLNDFGTSLTASDFVPGSSLASKTLAATLATSGVGGLGQFSMTQNGTNLNTGLNTAGPTRLVLAADYQRTQTSSPPSATAFSRFVQLTRAAFVLTVVVV